MTVPDTGTRIERSTSERSRPVGGDRQTASWIAVAVGVAMGLVSAWTDERGGEGPLLVLLFATSGYAVIAFAGRPAWSWPLLGGLVTLALAGELVGLPMTSTLPLLILTTVVAGSLLRRWQPPPDEMRWQAWSALGFVGAALVALSTGSTTALVVVGLALVAHGVWDVVHWRRHVVVSRTLSAWCAGLDLTLGLGVLVLGVAA